MDSHNYRSLTKSLFRPRLLVHDELFVAPFFFAAKEIISNTILKKFYDKVFGDDIKEQDKDLKEKLKELGGELSEIAEKGGEALDEIAGDFMEWIRARDPVSVSRVHVL